MILSEFYSINPTIIYKSTMKSTLRLVGGLGMFRLSDIRQFFILLTVTLIIMFIIPAAIAGGHGGGMGGMSMGGMSMGGMHGGGYYSSYYPTTSADWLGRYTPYSTTIGSPYSTYGYSPYNTRTNSLLGTSLGGYGGLYGYGGGVSNTYTTYIPGGEISTTVPSYGGYGYGGLYGGGYAGLGAYGLGAGAYGLGTGAGYGYGYPYSYGITNQLF